MEHTENERKSSVQTDLMIACKTGDIAAVREILKWRDVKGERVDINARDENGQTAFSFAKQSNNAEIVAIIEQNLFLRAVENGDTDTVKTYLYIKKSNFKVLSMVMNTIMTIRRRLKVGIETEFTSKDSITRSVWLKAVAISQDKWHDDILKLLFKDRRFIRGFNEDGQTIFHQIVAEYLAAKYYLRQLDIIRIFLKSGKFSANISNLQNETIFEYVCKMKPKQCRKIYDLLRIFHENRIDLNGRNRNGETFLMFACENSRIDIVRGLIKLAEQGFVLDIDAVDNSSETALMKAKQNNESKIVAALLGRKFMSAVENEKEDAMLKKYHFLLGFNDDELTTFYEVVAENLKVNRNCRRMMMIEIILKSRKYDASALNLQNETIFEIICKIKPICKMDDLPRILFRNNIDLKCRNKNGETFLMLACKNRRIKLVRSLLDLAADGFVLDIDAVDNSGETALMKAKERNFYEIVVALLEVKLISAVYDENAEIVKSMLAEFRNTIDIFVKSWCSNENHDEIEMSLGRKSDIWLKAMNIALQNETKHSEEILKLLLNCDILLSQEIEIVGQYFSFNRFTHRWKDDVDKRLRLIELLLKSGKINVNDRNENGESWLYWAEDERLISLLIRCGADVNRKDNKGKTPLMPIPRKRSNVLLALMEEERTLVDLDAMDCNGLTALMHAVKWHRSHDVELLLNKGASVNLSDHLGFTALHHALHRNIYEHFNFPRNSEELKKMTEMAILFDAEKHEHLLENEEWSEERSEIVEMLLQRPDIDVNLLSIEKYSPLDIADGQIPDLPSSIKDALKEKGAVLNVFRQTESQSTSDFLQDFTSMLTLILKQLRKTEDKLHNPHKTKIFQFLKKRLLTLIETSKKEKVSKRDQLGRTALHLVVISFYEFTVQIDDCTKDLAKKIVDKLISIGYSINETDIYGRTPLHYAAYFLKNSLLSHGADASIKDKDGNIAFEEIWHRSCNYKASRIVRDVQNRICETYLLRLMNNTQMEINVQCVDDSDDDSFAEFWRESVNLQGAPRLLWEKGEYSFRHPLVEKITKEVTNLMNAIAKEIERLDPRFEIRVEFVGSSNEGTKINNPDEFDFCMVLTMFSELCEVSLSPELPTGFVRLKRKPIKADKESDFDSFFGKDRILNTEKLNWQFTTILRHALININNQLSFEWILKYERSYDYIKKVAQIKMMKPLNFFTVDRISVDIVPCIHVDGWWPNEAVSNASDEMKKFGCNLIFDGPQELYPWVLYSEACARISFAIAESYMIKQSCDNAREAYMIGKTMIERSIHAKSNVESQYTLKNCLLYCIEALSPSSEKASQLGLSLEEMKSKFDQMDRYLWLKCLMKCHLEFVAQDFCPCYFLPTFSCCSLIFAFGGTHCLKNISLDWIAGHGSTTFPLSCKHACALYRCTSNDISKPSYHLVAPDPLWERFDRKQLIASLCEIAYK